jgi:hypothetical protein
MGCNNLLRGPLLSSTYSTPSHLNVVEAGQSNMVHFYGAGENEFRLAMSSKAGSISFTECAVGGTTIGQWLPDGYLMPNCGINKDTDIILWYQGESDAFLGYTNWDTQFRKIVAYWKSINPNVRVVYAQLADTPIASQYPDWGAVQQLQAENYGPNVFMIRTGQLATIDGLHLTDDSEKIVADRMAAML